MYIWNREREQQILICLSYVWEYRSVIHDSATVVLSTYIVCVRVHGFFPLCSFTTDLNLMRLALFSSLLFSENSMRIECGNHDDDGCDVDDYDDDDGDGDYNKRWVNRI